MITKTYRSIQIFIHFISILQILISIFLLITYTKYNSYLNLEYFFNLPYIGMNKMYIITIIINVIMSLFVLSSVYIRQKIYMKIYIFLCYFVIPIIGIFISYILFEYKKSLNFCIGQSTDIYMKSKIDSVYNTSGITNITDDSSKILMMNDVESLIRNYLILTGSSLLLLIFDYILIKIALKVRINQLPPEKPKIHLNERVGFETTSLRKKQVIQKNENDGKLLPYNENMILLDVDK